MNITPDPAETENTTFSKINTETIGQITCGVSRKVNVGNFENIDIYSSITLPVDLAGTVDMDELKAVIESVSAEGFDMVSKETGKRYALIKEATKQ